MKIIEPKVELWQQGDDSKAHVVDAQEFVMVEQQVMMKLLLNDLLMMNIGVCFVMELII
jgi:hypothetical protein